MRHVHCVDVCEGAERECVWACVCMHFWSWGSETSEDADEEAHWSLNTRPGPQATEQHICPCCFQTQYCHLPLAWRADPGSVETCVCVWRPVCSCMLPRQNVLSEKQCDHTWWENLLEPCVFFVLEGICWPVKLQPNSSLISIKAIPLKASCCVCTLGANCCRTTNPTNRQSTMCWCWSCRCKKKNEYSLPQRTVHGLGCYVTLLRLSVAAAYEQCRQALGGGARASFYHHHPVHKVRHQDASIHVCNHARVHALLWSIYCRFERKIICWRYQTEEVVPLRRLLL